MLRASTERWGGRLHSYAKLVRQRREWAILEGLDEHVLTPRSPINSFVAELHKLGNAAEALQRAIYWSQKAESLSSDVVEVIRGKCEEQKKNETLDTFASYIEKASDCCLDAVVCMRAQFGD